MPYHTVNIPAGAWDYDPTNYPDWEKLSGTNGEMIIDWFDDTTEQYLITTIQTPTNMTSGTVYIDCYGFAKVADGNEVQYKLSHSAKTDGEVWDAAYASVLSGDYVTNAVQDQLDYISWNGTVAALGWAANNEVRIMLSRTAIVGGTPVTGDHGITFTRIRMPIV
jgi:hypothetical protein